jgi:hypothetical protein
MRITKVGALITLAAAIALPAAAQKTDLSGTWKLNMKQSFLAGDHPDKDYGLTKTIVQKGKTISLTDAAVHVNLMNIPMPDSKFTVDLVADGQQHDALAPAFLPGLPPMKMKTVAEWQGGTLLVTETGNFMGPSTTQRRYYLSEDGRQLIELIVGHNGFGDSEQRLVFDKQP